MLYLRRYLPESPRWLLTHGHPEEAERVAAEIEGRVQAETGQDLPPPSGIALRLQAQRAYGFGLIARAMFQRYRRRAVLGLALMISQAFFHNAVFFTYALVLTNF